MSKSIIAFSLASILSTLGLSSCAQDEKYSNIISLKKLYSQSKTKPASWQNNGNFLRVNGQVLIFFSPIIRQNLLNVVNGELASFDTPCQIVDMQAGTSNIDRLLVSLRNGTLRFGSYNVVQSEIDRLQLSSGWQEVLSFCGSMNSAAAIGDSKGVRDVSIARIDENRFLITGGVREAIAITKSDDYGALGTIYNVQTKVVEKSFSLQKRRKNHCTLMLPNGNAILVGGEEQGLPSIELLKLDEGKGRLLRCVPGATRPYCTACLDEKGNCIIVGGWEGHLATENTSIEFLDIEKEKIVEVGKLKIPRFFPSRMTIFDVAKNATMIGNNKVLVSGGKSWIPGNTYGDIRREEAEIIELIMP